VEANPDIDRAIALLSEAAEQLEQAAAHCRVAVEHLQNREIPRMGAHAWAAHGHVLRACDQLDDSARLHSTKARPAT
jgi:hypothetical protein